MRLSLASKTPQTTMNKLFLTLMLTFAILACNAQGQREKEEKLRSEINTEFEQNLSNCYGDIDAVSDFNGKTEFWTICKLKNGNRIIAIKSHEKETYFQEIYFEKNGALIYAKETENFIPKNHFSQLSWSCQFYFKNGALISIMSLGHGKTEDEAWNPEVIFDMYKNRLTELERIKK